MRILYFLAHPHGIGGATKVLMTQASLMKSLGHEVLVVIQNDRNGLHNQVYEYLCKTLDLEYISRYYFIATCIEEIDLEQIVRTIPQLEKIIVDYKPDIMHSVQLNSAVEYLSRKYNIPHLMNIYQIHTGVFNINWLNIWPSFHSCDSIYYSEQWHRELGIESKCIRVAYDENKSTRTTQLKGRHTYIRLINIAAFSEHKQQLEILKFVKKIVDRGCLVNITFLGDNQNEYGKKCIQFTKDNDMEFIVEFKGFVTSVETYLCDSDLMILASKAESYPGVIVESMANRVAVLSTPVAGIPELVIDGKNGFLTSGYTSDDLVDAFERYVEYKSSGLINNVVDAAYETYMENHSFKSVTMQLLGYYKHIIEKFEKVNFAGIDENFNTVISYANSIKKKAKYKETVSHAWFLYHISKMLQKTDYRSCVIWGAGYWGKIAVEWCEILGLEVRNIIDTYKEGYFEGREIIKPSELLLASSEIIFLAMSDMRACEENMRVLERMGKLRNIDYFLTCNNPCLYTK